MLACDTTSERSLSRTVPRSARRLGASLLGCLWRVVHWVRGFIAHCRFPGSGSISPPCVVNERAVQVLSTPRRDSGWKRTCNMCGCRCPVPCGCATALQGTASRWRSVCAASQVSSLCHLRIGLRGLVRGVLRSLHSECEGPSPCFPSQSHQLGGTNVTTTTTITHFFLFLVHI